MIRLKPMTEEDYEKFCSRSIQEYIDNMSKNYDISIEAATEKATKQYDQLLNDAYILKNTIFMMWWM